MRTLSLASRRVMKCLVPVLLLVCAPLHGALAYQVGTTTMGKEIKWRTGKMNYVVNAAGGPSGSSDAVQAAANAWSSVSTTSFSFSYQGSSTSTAYGANDGTNLVDFGSLDSSSTIAQNHYWYSVSTGEMADSDIRFNTTGYTFVTNGSAGAMDVQNIGTHEFGHSLNLKDLYSSSDTEKTMYGYCSKGETKKKTLEQDDKDGISYLYPGTNAGTVKAEFSADPVSGRNPLRVAFTDASTGGVTAWLWDFGDGSTNTEQNPVHTYSSVGSYTVKLTVSGSSGSDTATKDSYINVSSFVTWSNWFAVDPRETPMVGDFNGDGRTDVITFTRDNPSAVGDVYVALSQGSSFGSSRKWNDWFAVDQTQTIVIGDFNGDGIDDIACWLGQSTKEVYVATSYGTGINPTGPPWLGSIGNSSDDVIKAGDANGDGMADLVLFARTQGKVYVALSTGTGFNTPAVWHDFFAVSTYERPDVGDVDGDGKVDIVTFATDSPTARGDVYVALSTGSKFGDGNGSAKWNDWFAVEAAQRVRTGDIDGDGKEDFATFLSEPYNQVYVVYSQGNAMSENSLVASGFSIMASDQVALGDLDKNGKADIVIFRQSEGKVYVMLME